jgi:hypothetical protein
MTSITQPDNASSYRNQDQNQDRDHETLLAAGALLWLHGVKSTPSVFSDGNLTEFLTHNTRDPWTGTPFQGYVHMDPKQKGEFGERFVERYASLRGFLVERAATSTAPYDRIIGGHRTEIKFSLAMRHRDGGVTPNRFIINHAAKGKDWDRFIFVCINGGDEQDWVVKWFTKADFISHLETNEDCLFRKQQGGKNGGNDDYMCSGARAERLIGQAWVKPFNEW